MHLIFRIVNGVYQRLYRLLSYSQQGLQSQLEEILNAKAVINGSAVRDDEQLVDQVKHVCNFYSYDAYCSLNIS